MVHKVSAAVLEHIHIHIESVQFVAPSIQILWLGASIIASGGFVK